MTNRALQPEAWFEKAEHDLVAVETLMAAPAIVWDVVGFHAQQAAEKYLKGFLVARGESVPRVHDLVALLGRCCKHDRTLTTLEADCERLTRIGWLSRYPDAPDEPSEEETRAGVRIAQVVRDAVRQRTRNPPDGIS